MKTKWQRIPIRAKVALALLILLYALGLAAPWLCDPHEIMRPEEFEQFRRVKVSLTPDIKIGRINIDSGNKITRSSSCEAFFPTKNIRGITFSNHYNLTPELESAIKARFANTSAPAFKTELSPRLSSGLRIEASLAEFSPREEAPQSVRLMLRDPTATKRPPSSWTFSRVADSSLVPTHPTRFKMLPLEERNQIMRLAQETLEANTEVKVFINVPDAVITAESRIENITWPFRPVRGHPLGIDAAGRDVLARILFGARSAMTFGILLVILSMILGVIIGALQGYFGGWLDLIAQRLIEIWSTLPFLYIMILIGAVLGRSFTLLLLCYALFNWIGISYYTRAEFLRLRHRPYVEAARTQGIPVSRIILRHILPNALTPLVTLLPFSLVGAIGSLSALDFLGFGLPPLTPSWGELLQQAQQNPAAWWLILWPSLILFFTMLLAVIIGEGLRDAFDPKPTARYR